MFLSKTKVGHLLLSCVGKKTKKVYFKLPYIGNFFQTQPKLSLKQICGKYCENTNIVVAFSPLKIGSFFSCKDSISKFLQSYVVYQFTCAGCNACYIGKTKRHLKTRFEEHFGKDKNSHILRHLQENLHCRQVSDFDCFDVIDRDNFHFRLQLKEATHITWKKPILNKQNFSLYFCIGYFILSIFTSF